jgi:hypothetical protein
MTNEHPITPPPELRQLWAQQAQRMNPRDPIAWQEHIATQAAQWGADQELKACCEWLSFYSAASDARDLRIARRPKPPSLKEQALSELEEIMTELHDETGSAFTASAIRRALEALDD